jgi:hypothetical protein
MLVRRRSPEMEAFDWLISDPGWPMMFGNLKSDCPEPPDRANIKKKTMLLLYFCVGLKRKCIIFLAKNVATKYPEILFI